MDLFFKNTWRSPMRTSADNQLFLRRLGAAASSGGGRLGGGLGIAGSVMRAASLDSLAQALLAAQQQQAMVQALAESLLVQQAQQQQQQQQQQKQAQRPQRSRAPGASLDSAAVAGPTAVQPPASTREDAHRLPMAGASAVPMQGGVGASQPLHSAQRVAALPESAMVPPNLLNPGHSHPQLTSLPLAGDLARLSRNLTLARWHQEGTGAGSRGPDSLAAPQAGDPGELGRAVYAADRA